jgi:methylenetetrahydrofolate/methylenetetrahydromethanopterin dehydrogenase (NADP+)
VGRRVARLLVRSGAHVTVASRVRARAEEVAQRIVAETGVPVSRIEAMELHGGGPAGSAIEQVLAGADAVIAAGAAGATLLDAKGRAAAMSARVLIDLNAVPPAGIAGIAAGDKARPDGGAVVYGALGVGGTKMKIHKAAIARIFSASDAFLDAEELLAIGAEIEAAAR